MSGLSDWIKQNTKLASGWALLDLQQSLARVAFLKCEQETSPENMEILLRAIVEMVGILDVELDLWKDMIRQLETDLGLDDRQN